MLANKVARFVQQSRNIQIYESDGYQNTSGIRATIFGATGFLGKAVGMGLGDIGSDIVYPSKSIWITNDAIKRLRLTANIGMKYVAHNTNFNDPRSIFRTMANSNVAVNLIGPRKFARTYDQFRNANIEVPKMIAKQARLAGVKRLIHFSSVGVDPRATSLDLQTKFYGEQAVRDEFPDATIFRPCTAIGMNDYFQRIFRKQLNWFNHFVPIYSDLTAKRQPIVDDDIALCVLNAIKMPETAGKVYELGGPHVYTIQELYEIMMNVMEKQVTFAKINRTLALKISLIKSWDFLSYDEILKSEIDLLVSLTPGTLTIENLLVRPASVIGAITEAQEQYKELIGVVKNDANI